MRGVAFVLWPLAPITFGIAALLVEGCRAPIEIQLGTDAPQDAAIDGFPGDASTPSVDSDTTAPDFAAVDAGEPSRTGYVDVTEARGFGAGKRYGRGVATADVNGDGRLDLFVVDTDHGFRGDEVGVSTLYLQGEEGVFEEALSGIDAGHLVGAWCASFADFDNDGDPDVAIASGGYTTTSTLSLYENRWEEEGRFVDATSRLGLAPEDQVPAQWWGLTWADLEGDGRLDLVATRVRGRPLVFTNRGEDGFSEVALERGIDGPLGTDNKNPVAFDADGDGDLDLYFAGMTAHAFYLNAGGRFRRGPDPFSDGERVSAFVAAASDFDQDGNLDLYVGRWNEQDLVLFGQGDASFVSRGDEIGLDALPTVDDDTSAPFENTMGMTIVDLFDDGWPDVYIGTGGPSRAGRDILYCNQRDGTFRRCTEVLFGPTGPETRGHGMTQADFDGDGRSEIFLNLGGHPTWDDAEGTDSREGARFFEPVGPWTSGAYVTLEGTRSARDAIGARVIRLGEGSFRTELFSTQGFQSQHARALRIPLDRDLIEAWIEIQWPSGTRGPRAGPPR